jgi:oligoendopeptidase F
MPWNTFASDEEAATGWQRWKWSLFRMPLSMITYPTAIVATCQLGRWVATDRASAVQDYSGALSLGNTEPLPALFRHAGVTFPFTAEAVAEAVDFVFEQWAGLHNG